MKSLKMFFVGLFLLLSIPVMAQSGADVDWPVLVVTLLIAIAEVLLRLIPNEKYTGLIGVLINLLKVISDYLNRRKSQPDPPGTLRK